MNSISSNLISIMH